MEFYDCSAFGVCVAWCYGTLWSFCPCLSSEVTVQLCMFWSY